MKITKYIMPYPVLGIEGAFEESCTVSSFMSFESNLYNYIFHIDFKMNDEMILNLIESGKASFSCEVDCVRTYYNQVFLTKKNKFIIEIPKTSLVGNVQFFFSVVAIDTIENYKNPNNNKRFYEGYKFNLQKGHLLSYLGERTLNADIKYDELKAIGTIVEVKEDNQQAFTHYDFSGDKIRIFLPSEDFHNFHYINSKQFADVTHASIVQCGLTSALYAFKKYQNTLWAQTLKIRVKTDPKLKGFENLEDLDDFQISKLVNLLLDNANKRMFSTLNTIRTNKD